MMVFPEADGPYSLDKSTLMVRMLPSTLMSTFFILRFPLKLALSDLDYNCFGFKRQQQEQ